MEQRHAGGVTSQLREIIVFSALDSCIVLGFRLQDTDFPFAGFQIAGEGRNYGVYGKSCTDWNSFHRQEVIYISNG